MRMLRQMIARWRQHKESRRREEEQAVADSFYITNKKMTDAEGGAEWCVVIMHDGVAIQRYWSRDCMKDMIDDLQRYRTMAVDELRTARTARTEQL